MNEMVKGWLKELYKDAMEETESAIANERLWANGAPNDEIAMHDENARLLEEYYEVLQDKLDELDDRKVCED